MVLLIFGDTYTVILLLERNYSMHKCDKFEHKLLFIKKLRDVYVSFHTKNNHLLHHRNCFFLNFS